MAPTPDDEDARRRFDQLPEQFRIEVREGQSSVYRAWASWWLDQRLEQGLDASGYERAMLGSLVPAEEAFTSDTPPDHLGAEFARKVAGIGPRGSTGVVNWRRVCELLDREP